MGNGVCKGVAVAPFEPKGLNLSTAPLVISGISCRLPESDNMEELWQNLIEKTDMVTKDDRRWPSDLADLPPRMGKLKDIEHFDAEFFNVPPIHANTMDPGLRIVLEVVYEAIVDSGTHPSKFRGSKTGVYVGQMNSDSQVMMTHNSKLTGYEATGTSRAMMSNRISFAFDLKGPSFTIDTACSSSLEALCKAVSDIRLGHCDQAIVCGVNIILDPTQSYVINKLNMLSPDGKCKSFDKSGNGYVRSEGVIAIFLQKQSDSKRIYLTVLDVLDNCDGFTPQGVSYPNGEQQASLLNAVYYRANIDPNTVYYVEAHGTGTPAGDPQEVGAISKVMCGSQRKKPLKIGSIKSNLGHTESTAGLAGLAKVILASEKGQIPGNLHFEEPNPNLKALLDGTMEVVDKPVQLPGNSIVGISSYGFGGANVHAIVQTPSDHKPIIKEENRGVFEMLVCSGRTVDSVRKILKSALDNKQNAEYLAMLMEAHANVPVERLPARGYCLLNNPDMIDAQICSYNDRPVWFVFPGMGSQWPGMAQDILKHNHTFQNAINKCHNALKRYSFNLIKLFQTYEESTFKDPQKAFVGITAVQIGLIEVLREYDIKPAGMIGHSLGELACAYCDGGLTLEQTIRVAFIRGKVVNDAKLKQGKMAAVGLTWKEAAIECSQFSGIVPACNNSPDMVTVSGEASTVDSFIDKMKSVGIFAREVDTSGIAFHSFMLKSCQEPFLRELRKVIPVPLPRSGKWLSTSIVEDDWATELAIHCSPEYHVNNFLNPVLFYNVLQKVPENALMIEIGPHGLFYNTLKKLGKDIGVVSTMKRPKPGEKMKNVTCLHEAIGKCYMHGLNLPTEKLYRQPDFPVLKGTPMISPLIGWRRTTAWDAYKYRKSNDAVTKTLFEVSYEDAYLKDHCVNGRYLFPASGYLYLAWKALANKVGVDFEQLAVHVKELRIHQGSLLPLSGAAEYQTILLKSGRFEISENNRISAEGVIVEWREPSPLTPEAPEQVESSFTLSTDEIYQALRIRGYEYGEEFQKLVTFSEGGMGKLMWNGKWIVLMDNLTHLFLINDANVNFYYPTLQRDVFINPMELTKLVGQEIPCKIDVTNGVQSCPGLKFRKINVSGAALLEQHSEPRCQIYHYIDYDTNCRRCNTHGVEKSTEICVRENFNCLFTTIYNNTRKGHLNMVFAGTTKSGKENLSELLKSTFPQGTRVTTTVIFEPQEAKEHTDSTPSPEKQQITNEAEKVKGIDKSSANMIMYNERDRGMMTAIAEADICIIMSNMSHHASYIYKKIPEQCFILHFSENDRSITETNVPTESMHQFCLIQSILCQHISMWMYRKRVTDKTTTMVKIDEQTEFAWVIQLKEEMAAAQKDDEHRIWVLTDGQPQSGVVGMINTLRLEPGGLNLRCVYNMDTVCMQELQDTESDTWKTLKQKDLSMNVHKDGKWGCFVHRLQALRFKEQSSSRRYVTPTQLGDITSLTWICDEGKPFNNNSKSCRVRYAGLMFSDHSIAMGALDGTDSDGVPKFGKEFSGIDSSGKQVFGFSKKSLATHCEPYCVFDVPPSWTMEEAVTVVIPYTVAYYAIKLLARLPKKGTVLVLGSETCFGQACLNVAKQTEATVFSLASKDDESSAKLGIDWSSDHLYEYIVGITGGKGLNLLIDCIGDGITITPHEVLASGGQYVDFNSTTGKVTTDATHGITYHTLNVDELLNNPSTLQLNQLVEHFKEGIKTQHVKPMKSRLFSDHNLPDAFRALVKNARQRVIVQLSTEGSSKDETPMGIKRTSFNSQKVYIITGGLGGLGLEMCEWMVHRGAQKMILTSRSGVRTGYQKWKLGRFAKAGADVKVLRYDVSEMDQAKQLITEAKQMGPLGGIFHLAAVLEDGFIQSQTPDTFRASCKVKINGTKNLDILTRGADMKTTMEWFIVFSSVASGFGNPGQSNYAFANSCMERIVEKRAEDLKDLSGSSKAIQWGLMGDVGIVQRELGGNKHFTQGTVPQRVPSFLNTFDMLLQANGVVYSSVVHDTNFADGMDSGSGLFEEIMQILGWSDDKATENVTFENFGMDSQQFARIQQILGRKYNIYLTAEEMSNLTPKKLKALQDQAG